MPRSRCTVTIINVAQAALMAQDIAHAERVRLIAHDDPCLSRLERLPAGAVQREVARALVFDHLEREKRVKH